MATGGKREDIEIREDGWMDCLVFERGSCRLARFWDRILSCVGLPVMAFLLVFISHQQPFCQIIQLCGKETRRSYGASAVTWLCTVYSTGQNVHFHLSLSSWACAIVVVVCLSIVSTSFITTQACLIHSEHSPCDTLIMHQITLETPIDLAYMLEGYQGRVEFGYIVLYQLSIPSTPPQPQRPNPPDTSITTTAHQFYVLATPQTTTNQPDRIPRAGQPIKAKERYIAYAVVCWQAGDIERVRNLRVFVRNQARMRRNEQTIQVINREEKKADFICANNQQRGCWQKVGIKFAVINLQSTLSRLLQTAASTPAQTTAHYGARTSEATLPADARLLRTWLGRVEGISSSSSSEEPSSSSMTTGCLTSAPERWGAWPLAPPASEPVGVADSERDLASAGCVGSWISTRAPGCS